MEEKENEYSSLAQLQEFEKVSSASTVYMVHFQLLSLWNRELPLTVIWIPKVFLGSCLSLFTVRCDHFCHLFPNRYNYGQESNSKCHHHTPFTVKVGIVVSQLLAALGSLGDHFGVSGRLPVLSLYNHKKVTECMCKQVDINVCVGNCACMCVQVRCLETRCMMQALKNLFSC